MVRIALLHVVIYTLTNVHAIYAQHVFDVRSSDRAYLAYFVIRNGFDSSATVWRFGEVQVHGAGGFTQRLNMGPGVTSDSVADAEPASGESALIRTRFVSTSCVLHATPHISYFREIVNSPYQAPADGWAGHYDINEPSEFVVQVVRDSDGVVLFTLDSVGTGVLTGVPDSAQISASYYGTEPNTCLLDRAVPAALAGIGVHLAISARRISANTTYGFAFHTQHQPIPDSRFRSANCTYTVNGDSPITTLWQERLDSIFSYADSMWAASCSLPSIQFWKDEGQAFAFMSRYYYETYDSIYGAYYAPRPCGQLGKMGRPNHPQESGLLLSPNPLTGDHAVTLVVPVQSADVQSVRITTMLGQDVTRLIDKFKIVSDRILQFGISQLPPGQYMVSIGYGSHLVSKVLIVQH
jgi:hypothetical protein